VNSGAALTGIPANQKLLVSLHQPHLRHLKKSECAMSGTTRYPFSFYSLNSGELPVYVRLFAQSA
jgi:hypothetical protein